jgi:hypothetical protein
VQFSVDHLYGIVVRNSEDLQNVRPTVTVPALESTAGLRQPGGGRQRPRRTTLGRVRAWHRHGGQAGADRLRTCRGTHGWTLIEKAAMSRR